MAEVNLVDEKDFVLEKFQKYGSYPLWTMNVEIDGTRVNVVISEIDYQEEAITSILLKVLARLKFNGSLLKFEIVHNLKNRFGNENIFFPSGREIKFSDIDDIEKFSESLVLESIGLKRDGSFYLCYLNEPMFGERVLAGYFDIAGRLTETDFPI